MTHSDGSYSIRVCWFADIAMCSSFLWNTIHPSVFKSSKNQFHTLFGRLFPLFWCIYCHFESIARICTQSATRRSCIHSHRFDLSTEFVNAFTVPIGMVTAAACQSHVGQFTQKSIRFVIIVNFFGIFSFWIIEKKKLNAFAGDIVTEKHLMPDGGFFDFVSSPHMFFEMLMYCTLTVMLANNSSWWFVFLWVVSNQMSNGWLTHKWYLDTFKNYPKERRAILPGIL